MADQDITLGGYLLLRLKQMGVDHLFGVPGDFVLGFLNQVMESEVAWVGTCNELNAAYAADGYARIRGAGAFASTYGVGELSALNGVAGSFAEGVPVVVITGSPSRGDFNDRPLLHHTLGDYRIPLQIYEKVTVASTQLDSPETAPGEIDRVLSACLARQMPVYLSLPSDLVAMTCPRPGPFPFPEQEASHPEALAEALKEALAMLEGARTPLVLGDGQLIRFKLQEAFLDLLDRTGLPFVTMMLGKGVVSERHPRFLGLFSGDRSRAAVRERVDSADCILQLGGLMTDFNTGGFTTNLDASRTISAGIRTVKIRHHVFEEVQLGDFLRGLAEGLPRREPGGLEIPCASLGCVHRATEPYRPEPDRALTTRRFFDRMSHLVEDGSIILAETGVSLFSAAETLLPEGATFIAQTFYGSIGYTVGATLGVCLAAPGRKVVLFIGDGSFQVTGQDLSTMIRNGCRPQVFLLNNDGYTIERVITDRPYNDLQPWRYHGLPEAFGGAPGLDARTEGELERALAQAAKAGGLAFIEIHTGPMDCPESLLSAGRSMARANHLA